MTDQLLSVKRLSKTFPGQRALIDSSISVRAGEVHALVGANGSGKSTMVKILAGYHDPDPNPEVEFEFMGEPMSLSSPVWRERSHFIHQDLGLIPTLNGYENLALGSGFMTGRFGRIQWGKQRRAFAERFAALGLEVDLGVPVSQLARAEQTIIAIARALDGWSEEPGILVLDEPTAALSAADTEPLFAAVRNVVASGSGVIFVSHRLQEVFEIADQVTVLRDGRVVAARPIADLDSGELVRLIAGRHIDDLYTPPPPAGTEVAFSVAGLSGPMLEQLDFEIHEGEILGIGGLQGSGREQVASLLSGASREGTGKLRIRENEVRVPMEPREAISFGVGCVPIDRLQKGSIPAFSMRENLTLPWLNPFRRAFGYLAREKERDEVRNWIESLDIRPADPERQLQYLSGGNQQKVVIAKWLRLKPRVLILDEPTQGVDVGAKASIHMLLADIARAGTGILITSSEDEELVNVCDRVLVLRNGRLSAELNGSTLTQGHLLRASIGGQG